jgi:hypothetical protein
MLRSALNRSGAISTKRMRKCAVKGCANRFQARNMGHKVCGPECAVVHAAAERKRLDAKQTRERKQALKTRSDWLKEAQVAVNAYVRARDAHLPCISCGRHHEGQYHAGHYLARGSHPHLALVEVNLAKQCAPCNTHLSGNQLKFRVGLIERIGLAAVEALEADTTPRKHTITDLREIREAYRSKLKELRKEQA